MNDTATRLTNYEKQGPVIWRRSCKMANLEQGALLVETTDLMTKAMQDAMSRINAVPATANLVDQISKDDWVKWDASDEMALVADSSGLEDDCDLDDSLQAA